MCLCPSGDAVHREEAAESSVSLCFKPPVWFSARLDASWSSSYSLFHTELLSLTFDLCRYVLIDTPGQIEVFTWSASGTIITEALVGVHAVVCLLSLLTRDTQFLFVLCVFQASSFPCVVIYVMDTSRSVNPVTFMSNMLYACRYVTIRLLL